VKQRTANIVIFGAGGLGRMVQDILQQSGRWRPVAFLDSNPRKNGKLIGGLPVIGDIRQASQLVQGGLRRAVVAIGNNQTRAAIAGQLAARGFQLVSAVHPLASISPTAAVGDHVIIGPRVSICVHSRIGPDTVISAGSIIEHDNIIGRAVFLHPAVRLAGTVAVDDLATLGIGACVIPGRRIGRGAVVEAGTVVIRDVESGAVVGGVPGNERSPSRFAGEPMFGRDLLKI
jgi:sugar O-acyltransferase (sialic acid O-acetyltransferase NeuD family)